MTLIVTILFVLTAFLLIGVILIQQPKTAGGLFSGTGQSLLGTSGKSFWTKFTTILAGIFIVLCLLMSLVNRYQQSPSSVTDLLDKQQAAPPAQVPVSTSAQKGPSSQAPVNPAPQGQAPSQSVPSTSGDSKK